MVYTTASTDTVDYVAGSTTYSLKAGTGDVSAFSINATSGAVTLTGNPIYSTKSSYAFTVVATDAANNASEQAVSLVINQVAPGITSGATATALNENAGLSQTVYTTTTAGIAGNIVYSLKPATGDGSSFTINSNTGVVKLNSNPNYEIKTSYNFTVVATAGSTVFQKAVTLAINNLDEQAPTFTSGSTATAINENSGAGQAVYAAISTDTTDYVSGSTTYSLKANNFDDAAAFSINGTTGAVTLTANPDYEAYRYGYHFTVVATDAANNKREKAVTLAINNLDDTAPNITSGSTATALAENTSAGRVVYTANSTDTNDVCTGSTVYSLKAATGDVSAFSINASSGAVTFTGTADYETKAIYSFTVVATDTAGNFSEKAVTMAITNKDEVAPTFTSGDAATPIIENSGAGQVVYTATSTDTVDIVSGMYTRYSIKAGTGDASAFSINMGTGAVTLTGNPDYETKSSYSFTVVATDQSANATEKAVTLQIIDAAELSNVVENSNTGLNQLVYSASGGASYSLKQTSDAGLAIDPATGAVTLTVNPDYEVKRSYNFTVLVTDGGGTTTEQVLTFSITDVDDTAPSFSSPTTAAAAIDENSGAGQVIFSAYTTDPDSLSTVYSLKANAGDASAFTINASTGAVTLTGNPDFETKASYTFTVVATDPANNFSEQAVTLAINNLDEVAPTITSGSVATAIDENSSQGQVIYTATATDFNDIAEDVASSLEFTLKAGSDSDLSINRQTGEVTLNVSPDFETKSSYSFTVVATDTGHNAVEKAVTLAINDRDETPPTFTSGGWVNASAVNENTAIEQTIYTPDATDFNDRGDNTTSSLVYSLGQSSDEGLAIDSETGAVSFTASPDYETKSTYNFTVVATDTGHNAVAQNVELQIANVDEVAPTFNGGDTGTAQAIDDGSGGGQMVYQAYASDSDYEPGASSVTFSLNTQLSDDHAAFTIDGTTGEVTLTADPDYEALSSYHFTVVAEDAVGNKSQQAVTLAVNMVDHIAPLFSPVPADGEPIVIDVLDGISQGGLIYTVSATDKNDRGADTTSGVTYSFPEWFQATGLSINASTGQVRLTATNVMDAVSYIYVNATDKAGNESLQTFNLNIMQSESLPSIAEQSGSPTAPQLIHSIPSDGNEYTLRAGMDGALFRLDPTADGYDVVLIGTLDYETKSDYGFLIIDQNGTSKAYSLSITNVDEVAPIITSNGTASAIAENSGAGQVVYTATSTDSADIAIGATAYSLKAGSDAGLTIDSTTGAVTLANNPNFENKPSYSFRVVATDGAGHATEKAVTLAIDNRDEVAPSFRQDSDYVNMYEKLGANALIDYLPWVDDTVDYVSGSVTYSLKPGEDSDFFSIDAASGAVRIKVNPVIENALYYNFTVVATDASGNASEQALTITVMNRQEALTWSTTQLQEDSNNLGVPAATTITLSYATFTGNIGDALPAVWTGIPAGLTAVLTKTSDTTATLSFTGHALAHEAANSIAARGISVTWADSAFDAGTVGYPSSRINGANNSSFSLTFRDRDPVPDILVETLGTVNTGFVINGECANDRAGIKVAGIGDVNGDGLSDLLIGTKATDRYDGYTYVVFGKSDQTTVELSAVAAGTGGFLITGDGFNDMYSQQAANSISPAGDVNGDGLADLIIGAPLVGSTAYGRTYQGASYVVFGKTDGGTVNLADVQAGLGGGFVISGQSNNAAVGYSVSSAGDVNGDGLADVIVGAPGYNTNGSVTTSYGSFVVFGTSATTAVQLSAISAGIGGFRLGTGNYDGVGTYVDGLGDVNGDGLSDLIVGAPNASNYEGKSFVVFGKTNTANISFVDIANGVGGFVINGQSWSMPQGPRKLGLGVAGLGDVNGDGLADMVVNDSLYGYSYVVFGKTSTAAVEVTAVAAGVGGFRAGAGGTYELSARGDINGDGLADSYVGDASTTGAGDVNGDGLADLLIFKDNGAFVVFGSMTGSFVRTAVDGVGTSNADTFTGSTASETYAAGAGNDTMTGNGGADVLYGGAGSDTFILNADNVAKLSAGTVAMVDAYNDNPKQLAHIDGGSGIDTIKLDGTNIDLTTIANQQGVEPVGGSRIESIERIDMTGGGNNTVTLALKDVLDMAGMNSFNNFTGWADGTYNLAAGGADGSNPERRHQLVIDGDAGDAVHSSGWGASVGTVTNAGVTYNVYNQGLYAQLLIDTAVTQTVL